MRSYAGNLATGLQSKSTNAARTENRSSGARDSPAERDAMLNIPQEDCRVHADRHSTSTSPMSVAVARRGNWQGAATDGCDMGRAATENMIDKSLAMVATRKLKRIMVRSCGASECRSSTALRMFALGRHVQSATAVAAASDKVWGGSEDEIGCELSSRASSATAALPPAVCQ